MKGADNKHIIAFRATKLKPGEDVLEHLEGWIGDMMGKGDKKQHNGQFVLTTQRACFYRKGMLGEVFETIPLGRITSVETLSRLGYRVLRLHTSHDELSFKTFEAKDLHDRVYEKLEAQRDPRQDTVSPGATSQSIPDQIKKLADLRDAGILTDEEFSTKKTDLLQRM